MSEEFSDDTVVRQGPRALRVLRPLGEGGMGEVTVGARREGRFERTYAIKRLRPELRALPEARRAFLDEDEGFAGRFRRVFVCPLLPVGFAGQPAPGAAQAREGPVRKPHGEIAFHDPARC